MTHTREILGFLCRWCLLGGTAAVVAVVGWASLLATGALGDEVGSEFLMRDAVACPADAGGRTVYLWGHVRPAPAMPGMDVCLADAAGQPLKVVRTRRKGCVLVYRRVPAGRTRVTFRGMPYSTLAFQAGSCWLLAVHPDRPVFLFDARLALVLRRGSPADWHACRRDMLAQGELALFHPGPGRDFELCLRDLRSLDVSEPVLFDDHAPSPNYTLRQAARALARARGQAMEVVTADESLAVRAARQGFLAHLVGPSSPPARPQARLKRHASPAKFKESMSARPIPL